MNTFDVGLYHFKKVKGHTWTADERRLRDGVVIAIPHPIKPVANYCFGVDVDSLNVQMVREHSIRLSKVVSLPEPTIQAPHDTLSQDTAQHWARLNAVRGYLQLTKDVNQLSL